MHVGVDRLVTSKPATVGVLDLHTPSNSKVCRADVIIDHPPALYGRRAACMRWVAAWLEKASNRMQTQVNRTCRKATSEGQGREGSIYDISWSQPKPTSHLPEKRGCFTFRGIAWTAGPDLTCFEPLISNTLCR